MKELLVNGRRHRVDADPAMPLLWALREKLGLTGTKFGCGIGVCGACRVLVDGVVRESCVLPLAEAGDTAITTIEGLSVDGSHPLQRAWIRHQVPQCGYCQSGMLITAAALLRENPQPTDAQIDAAMTNVCRCGTYPRVRAAIREAARG